MKFIGAIPVEAVAGGRVWKNLGKPGLPLSELGAALGENAADEGHQDCI